MTKRMTLSLRRLFILSLFVLALWFVCSNIHLLFAKNISIHQPIEEICQIEFGYSPWDENLVIYKLDATEHDMFIASLLELKCFKRSSPSGHHGSLYVQITYYDGSVEILGSSSLRYMSGKQEEHDGWYYLMEEDLYELFSQYTDLSKFPYWE